MADPSEEQRRILLQIYECPKDLGSRGGGYCDHCDALIHEFIRIRDERQEIEE